MAELGLTDILALQKLGAPQQPADVKSGAEVMGAGLMAASQDISADSLGGGLAKGLLQGVGIQQQKKGASKREQSVDAYIQAQKEYHMGVQEQVKQLTDFVTKAKTAELEKQQQQGAIDTAYASLMFGSGRQLVELINGNEKLKPLVMTAKPEGAIELKDVVYRNGNVIPVWADANGGEAFGKPLPEAAIFSPEAIRAQKTAQLEEVKSQAQIEAINAQRDQRLADAQGGGEKAPPGYRYTADGNLEAIPGGPAFQKSQTLDEKQQAKLNAAISQADRLIMKVDQALEKTGVMSSGIGGSIMSRVPGTDARDLAADLETIKANLGFAELQAMREASPTGGALGQVAVQELVALQSTVASLDQAQSSEQLRQRLGEIRKHYTNWRDAVMQDREGQAAVGGQSRLDGNQSAEQIRAAYQAGEMTREQARAALQQLGAQ
jgi:hypothetical protein